MQPTKVMDKIETLRHPLAAAILDRSRPLTKDLVNRVISLTQFGWPGRNPRAVFDVQGHERGTDLDLLSVLVSLYRRGTKVTLSSYRSRTPWRAYQEERHIGSDRHGWITGLVAHHDQLSFSIQLEDVSVVSTDGWSKQNGALRNFMIADYDGDWYDGWNGLTWEMSPEEAAFFSRRRLLDDGTVNFDDYLHRNRRESPFGSPYVLMKLLLLRIEDELRYRLEEYEKLSQIDFGLRYNLKSSETKTVIAKGPATGIAVPTFTMKLSGLTLYGNYQPYPATAQAFEELVFQVIEMRAAYRPQLQFLTRAAEVAFYRFGRESDYVAPWQKCGDWEVDRVTKRDQIALGQKLCLSYQCGEREIMVAA